MADWTRKCSPKFSTQDPSLTLILRVQRRPISGTRTTKALQCHDFCQQVWPLETKQFGIVNSSNSIFNFENCGKSIVGPAPNVDLFIIFFSLRASTLNGRRHDLPWWMGTFPIARYTVCDLPVRRVVGILQPLVKLQGITTFCWGNFPPLLRFHWLN